MLDKACRCCSPSSPFSTWTSTFALYSHDMSGQIETNHYISRLNQDFLKCDVYDFDHSSGRLIGVEYIFSDRILEALPPEEQKLWHSACLLDKTIKSGLWVNPRVPEMVGKRELANTYWKFLYTWQVDRGHRRWFGMTKSRMVED